MIDSPISVALAGWVVGVTGRVPVFATEEGMGPRPPDPFAEMLVGTSPVGEVESLTTSNPGPKEEGVEDMADTGAALSDLRISMNLCKGANTREDMERLRASMGTSTWIEHLAAAGLGFASVGDSRDLSDIVKEQPEPRTQADWLFHTVHTFTAALFSIEQITINDETRVPTVPILVDLEG